MPDPRARFSSEAAAVTSSALRFSMINPINKGQSVKERMMIFRNDIHRSIAKMIELFSLNLVECC
jgi:hypothetical protein